MTRTDWLDKGWGEKDEEFVPIDIPLIMKILEAMNKRIDALEKSLDDTNSNLEELSLVGFKLSRSEKKG